MKILYNQTDGRIFYSVYNTDYFKFTHTTNIPLTILEIDEIDPNNKAVCLDLAKYGNAWKNDIDGNGKYYMQNDSGVWNLYSRDNWEEYIPEL